jgi:hypothetical protein
MSHAPEGTTRTEIRGGRVTLQAGGGRESCLWLPIIR